MDGWVWNTPGTHPAMPVVSLVLITLSVLVAIETMAAIFFRRGGEAAGLDIMEEGV
jgi:hypothetical protein